MARIIIIKCLFCHSVDSLLSYSYHSICSQFSLTVSHPSKLPFDLHYCLSHRSLHIRISFRTLTILLLTILRCESLNEWWITAVIENFFFSSTTFSLSLWSWNILFISSSFSFILIKKGKLFNERWLILSSTAHPAYSIYFWDWNEFTHLFSSSLETCSLASSYEKKK